MKQQNKIKTNKTKYFFRAILALSISVFFISCENENLKPANVVGGNIEDEVSIKNGRLFFQSKEAFVRIYQKYANASDDEISTYLQPFYEKGFYSLRPIATEKNEEFLYNHYNKIIKNEILSKKNISKTNLKLPRLL